MPYKKSDAMIQHEKYIAEIITHNPKRPNNDIMRIEVANYILAASALVVVVMAAVSIMQ